MSKKTLMQRVITGPDHKGFFANMFHNLGWMTLGVVSSESIRAGLRGVIRRQAERNKRKALQDASSSQAMLADKANHTNSGVRL